MATASALTDGMVIRVEGQVYRVLRVESKAAAAKMGGIVKAELSNVASGRVWEARFRPQEHVEELQVERRNMEFLFREGETSIFMDPGTFEQVEVPSELLGVAVSFLQSGTTFPWNSSKESPSAPCCPKSSRLEWFIPRHLLILNKTMPGKKRRSKTALRFTFRCSLRRRNGFALISGQAVTSNAFTLIAGGSHEK